jgi:hypothetical protein
LAVVADVVVCFVALEDCEKRERGWFEEKLKKIHSKIT